MATPFAPTGQDVERYRRFRALSMELSHRIVKTIPPRAYDEVGDAIGVLHNGVLVFDSEDMSNVMLDCCLYNWFENGKNLVQRYAETHPPKPGTDESYLLNAYTQARYRILALHSAVPDAGVHCSDVLNNEDFFLMDLAMSRGLGSGGASFATRTIPLGEYSMTSGAGLPINSKKALQSAFGDTLKYQSLVGPDSFAIVVVRALLAAGAAYHIAYGSTETISRKPRIEPRFPGFKRRRR